MKKNYLFILFLTILSISNAQDIPSVQYRAEPNEYITTKTNNQLNKTPGDILWSENFSGGFPSGWSVGGADGSYWVVNNMDLNPTNYSPSLNTNTAAIASTSGGNHMLFFGENITPKANRDAYFQTSAIALTGQTSVAVRLQSKFRLCCQSTAKLNLLVSTDPNFTLGATTKTYNIRGGVTTNTQSEDPLISFVNITDLVGGYIGNIYLRIQWGSGASEYYWMVDDIEVIENITNDIAISDGYYGTSGISYTRIPYSQIQPIDFSARVTNIGANVQTGTVISTTLNGGVFTGVSSSVMLNALALGGQPADAEDSLVINSQFIHPNTNLGLLTPTIIVSSDFLDENPSNNTITLPPFMRTSNIYAVDDYGINGIGNGGGEDLNNIGSREFEAGNYFDIYTAEDLYGVYFHIGSKASIYEELDVAIYSVDALTGDFTKVGFSQILVTESENIDTMVYLNVFNSSDPQQPVPLNAGTTYFAAIHSIGNTVFYYGTSGSSANPSTGKSNSLIYYPNMTDVNAVKYYASNTPMIRLNFDGFAVGISDKTNNTPNFEVYPNPSVTGLFNINLTKNMGNIANLMVKNITGQTVLKKKITINGNQTETISLNSFGKGIYFLTINNETIKLVVE